MASIVPFDGLLHDQPQGLKHETHLLILGAGLIQPLDNREDQVSGID